MPAIKLRIAFTLSILVAAPFAHIQASDSTTGEELGLRIAPEFNISLYADSDLANDIYCMTLDSQGRVVVSSAGFIKTLHDSDNDGRADRTTIFATPRTGAMGLCFDGPDLYAAAEGALLRYRDADNDGIADGPPQRLLQAAFYEHGAHSIRKGPDGFWYFIGGNDAGFTANHVTMPGSPVRNPEAGALLRFSPDFSQSEIIAHGFRNPYDFDFNASGDLFTFDSDVESDFFLPWYTPTRLYHVALGGHHGWRLEGWRRSWNRPDYYLDTTDVLWLAGRGSPTGVAAYRHTQFPLHYRNGLFLLDWTFGKIYFVGLNSNGSTYRPEPELFLEPIGSHGFAPNDAVVAPDGSLLVSIGGRKTRGAVYRIQHMSALGTSDANEPRRQIRRSAPELEKTPSELLDEVLRAPQPLDAWSRARWMPIAQQLGPQLFKTAIVDERMSIARRLRAIEVVTEMFGGIETPRAMVAAQSALPQIRARVAWSIGRVPCDDPGLVLLPLAGDNHPIVRRAALEAICAHTDLLDPKAVAQLLPKSFKHRDKRLRQAAAQLASRLPAPAWQVLEEQSPKFGLRGRLTWTLAGLWRNPSDPSESMSAAQAALMILSDTFDPELQLDAVRLLMLAWGDWNLQHPSVEAYSAYELAPSPLNPPAPLAAKTRQLLGTIFPSGDRLLDAEIARLLGMLNDGTPAAISALLSLITETSAPRSDFHYLTVLSRLGGSRSKEQTSTTARVLIDLEPKLAAQAERNKQNWTLRLSEITTNLIRRDPLLADVLLAHPELIHPAQIPLIACLPEEHRGRAARQFANEIMGAATFTWTGQIIPILSALPAEESFPMLRQQWSQLALRDAILLQLSRQPDILDAPKFLAGLESKQYEVVRACINALMRLSRDPRPENMVPIFRLLNRLLSAPDQADLRRATMALINRQARQTFSVQESSFTSVALREAYNPVFKWFETQHPEFAKQIESNTAENLGGFLARLKTVPWDSGDAARGEQIFRARACHTCHSSATSIGPDLSGVTSRMSKEDLFIAIADPNRDIAPPYRATTFETIDGAIHTGLIAFESADGVILQTGPATTIRLNSPEILSRDSEDNSLMPTGLLSEMTVAELADLHSFLRESGTDINTERTARW